MPVEIKLFMERIFGKAERIVVVDTPFLVPINGRLIQADTTWFYALADGRGFHVSHFSATWFIEGSYGFIMQLNLNEPHP